MSEIQGFWEFGANGVIEMGKFVHSCEGEMVCESVNVKIPYFNAPIYLENKVRSLKQTLQSFTEANSCTATSRQSR